MIFTIFNVKKGCHTISDDFHVITYNNQCVVAITYDNQGIVVITYNDQGTLTYIDGGGGDDDDPLVAVGKSGSSH